MKTIIAATDFSETSGAAMREAIHFARVMNARIVGAFVQNTTDIRYALGNDIPLNFEDSANLKKELSRHIAKKFNSFLQKYAYDYPMIDTIVLRGMPWEEINKLARKRKADLIVVGSRGLSPLKIVFVGSTTQNLIRISSCPVLVIHKTRKVIRKKRVA